MKPRHLMTLFSLSLLLSLPAVSSAQAGRDKPNPAQEKKARAAEMRSQAEQTVEEATAGRPEDPRVEERMPRGGDGPDAPDVADEDVEAGMQERADQAATKGNEKAQEMRARRDERKAIQEEYRAGRTQGQEGGADDVGEDEEETEEDEQRAKKPWWKFWGD